jgi:hypothetical protein
MTTIKYSRNSAEWMEAFGAFWGDLPQTKRWGTILGKVTVERPHRRAFWLIIADEDFEGNVVGLMKLRIG